jgi:hypothetical protein
LFLCQPLPTSGPRDLPLSLICFLSPSDTAYQCHLAEGNSEAQEVAGMCWRPQILVSSCPSISAPNAMAHLPTTATITVSQENLGLPTHAPMFLASAFAIRTSGPTSFTDWYLSPCSVKNCST